MRVRTIALGAAAVVTVAVLVAVVLLLSWGGGAGTRVAADSPQTSPPEISIGIDVNGDETDECSTKDGTKCDIAGVFRVKGYINAFADDGYRGFVIRLSPSDAVSAKTGVANCQEWFDAEGWTGTDVSGSIGDDLEIACAVPLRNPPKVSTHKGLVGTAGFNCDAEGAGTITLVADGSFVDIENPAQDETLDINCLAITPTPTVTPTPTITATPTITPTPTSTKQPAPGDTDEDGCPDADENGADERDGGRRDYKNPWDYFNPTNDGENRIDDVLAVINHYRIDEGEEGYDTKYDRILVGPNAWNLGAPNGQIRIDDVVNIISQYRHDCGTGIVKPTPTP